MQSSRVQKVLENYLVVKSSAANPEIKEWNTEYLPTFYILDETGTNHIEEPKIGFFGENAFVPLLEEGLKKFKEK